MALNNAINSPMLGGISTLTNKGVLLGAGASTITASADVSGALKILVGDGTNPTVQTLVGAGTVSVGQDGTSVTITGSSSPLTYSAVSGTTQGAVAGNGYILNNSALTTVTLPATAAVGTTIAILSSGLNTGGWTLAQNASQTVQVGNQISTAGTGGSISSTSSAGGDAIWIVCTVANTSWVAQNAVGSLTIV